MDIPNEMKIVFPLKISGDLPKFKRQKEKKFYFVFQIVKEQTDTRANLFFYYRDILFYKHVTMLERYCNLEKFQLMEFRHIYTF